MIACTVLGGAAGCYDYVELSLCPPAEHDDGEETIPPSCVPFDGGIKEDADVDAGEEVPEDAGEDAPTDAPTD